MIFLTSFAIINRQSQKRRHIKIKNELESDTKIFEALHEIVTKIIKFYLEERINNEFES